MVDREREIMDTLLEVDRRDDLVTSSDILNSTQFIDIWQLEAGLNKHRENIIKHNA